MNRHKPDWYERMKIDPFARKTFTSDSIDAIEKRVAEEQPGGRKSRKPQGRLPAFAAMACAAVLLAVIVLNTGGTSWWKDVLHTVTNQSPPPAVSPSPTPNEAQRTYRLKGEVDALERPEGFTSQSVLFTADPLHEVELLGRNGPFVQIESGGRKGWIPDWYVAAESDTSRVVKVEPYVMLVDQPVAFRLYPEEPSPSGFELWSDKVVQVTKEYEDWVCITVITYDSPYVGDKWVLKSALAPWDPSKAKEGLLKNGAKVTDESGSVKDPPPPSAVVWIEKETDGKYSIIAAGGYSGFIDKADFVPNPFRTAEEEGSDTLADEAWRVTPELLRLYESFGAKMSDDLLKDLEPMDVFKLYVLASERGEYAAQYALYIKGEQYATPNQAEYMKDIAADRDGAARSKGQWTEMKGKYRLKQEINGDSAYIIMSDGSGSPEGERAFSLTRTKEGVWKVSWLPMQ